jgi:hypothetical protein
MPKQTPEEQMIASGLEIKEAINKLTEKYTSALNALNILTIQLQVAESKDWDHERLSEYMLTDYNILEMYGTDKWYTLKETDPSKALLYDELEEIQDDILEIYGK